MAIVLHSSLFCCTVSTLNEKKCIIQDKNDAFIIKPVLGSPLISNTRTRFSSLKFSLTTPLKRNEDSIFVANSIQNSSIQNDRIVTAGDMVSVHYQCFTENGELLMSSDDGQTDPLTFEVGSGNFMGNPLFQCFDAVVQGLCVGQSRSFDSVSSARDEALVFSIPMAHEEIVRIKEELGNDEFLKDKSIVRLRNGQDARVIEVSDGMVKIDANHPLAGSTMQFKVIVVGLEST